MIFGLLPARLKSQAYQIGHAYGITGNQNLNPSLSYGSEQVPAARPIW